MLKMNFKSLLILYLSQSKLLGLTFKDKRLMCTYSINQSIEFILRGEHSSETDDPEAFYDVH